MAFLHRPAPPRPLALFLAAAWALAGVLGASSSSSGSASTDVGDCSIGDWLANPLLVQCGVDGGYNFSSGVQPTVKQAQAMCGSASCTTLFQAASLSTGVRECTLPFGDHIRLLQDLVNFTLGICYGFDSASSSASNSASSTNNSSMDTADSSSVATDASASSDGDSSTPTVVGIIVGVVALLVLVAGLLYWRRRRQQHKQESTAGSSGHDSQRAYEPMLSTAGRAGLLALEPANTPGQSTNTTATTASGATVFTTTSKSSKRHRSQLADLTPWRVDVESIQDLDRLGHGAHGVVWRVMYRGSTVLASKRIQTDQISHKRTQDFIDEIALISSLRHPNIVAFVGVAWTMESDLQVLLEFMDAGDLREHLLKPETPRSWTLQKLSIAHDIVQALVYVHSFQPPLMHRDLKSQNVMLTSATEDAVENCSVPMVETALTAKLTDFGVSRFHSENNTMTVGVGTSRWLAPEVILGKPNYGPEADVYSFGVVLSELDTHALPYNDARSAVGEPLATVAILQRVAMGQLKPTFDSETCPPELLALAQQCLEHDSTKRITALQAASELRRIIGAMAAATGDMAGESRVSST